MKKIGIPGWKVGDNSFGVTSTYLEFISHYGKPIILMPEDDEVQDINLLILSGGLDLNPSSYGRRPRYFTSNQDVFKQFFFDKMLHKYIDANIPIFGICLGHQMLCAYFGATLTQDLNYHEQSSDRWKVAHKIYPCCHESKVLMPANAKFIEVNSHHHQAVTLDDIEGTDIVPLFTTENHDGDPNNLIVEASRHSTKPIYSVQYHPEELLDCVSDSFVRTLLNL